MNGIERIAAERKRQLTKWSAEHDSEHQYADLAVHAAALAVMGTDASVEDPKDRGSIGRNFLTPPGEYEGDCWGLQKKHKGNPIRQLEIAGALIAAEIDRLQQLLDNKGESDG